MLIKPSFSWLFPAFAPSTKKGESPAPESSSRPVETEEEEDDYLPERDDDLPEMGDDEEEDEGREAMASTLRTQAPDSEVVSVPAFYRSNCRKGLAYVEKGFGGDGLKRQTINEAREIASTGRVSVEKLRRLSAWLKRHKSSLASPKNRNPKAPGYPGPGLVAWLLWAGDPDGSSRAAEWADKKLAALDRDS